MTRDEAEEYIKNNSDVYFKEHLSRYDRKRGYPLCPKCEEHEIQPVPKKEGYYKCFKCEASGDVFDFIGFEYGITGLKSQLDKAIGIYNIQINERSNIKETKDSNMEPKQDTAVTEIEEKENFTEYYNKCIKNLKNTDYLTKRGISNPELLERFKIGYDLHWQSQTAVKKAGEEGKDLSSISATPRIIIPTSDYSYLARSVDDNEKYKVMKEGKVHLFNSEALVKSGGKPLFIVEGEIDALSILECGFEAVGLTGTAFVNLLVSGLKSMLSNKQPVPLLILYLDNDDPGKNASKKLETNLKELEIFYVNFYKIIKEIKVEQECNQNLETLLKVKDPNEALTALINKESFKEILLDIRLRTIFKNEEIRRNAEFEITKMKSKNEEEALLEYLKSIANRPALHTGFTQLDETLNGGFKGGWLYGIGAMPSLGKTTFVMQIVDYIAKKIKKHICVFSLEMSKNDIMLKSITRENYKKSPEPTAAISVSDILKICNDEEYNELIKNEHFTKGLKHYFKEISPYVHINQGTGNAGINEIKQKIKEFDATERELSVIIVDYVQILSPYKSDNDKENKIKYTTDKQNLDKNIMELKRIARDNEIPVIAIFSFNRSNYLTELCYEAFKESGAIEYSADVLIGMQLKVDRTGWGNESQTKNDEKRQKINEAKIKYPREIELVILKNRFGEAYKKMYFNYYPKYEFFEETEKETQSSLEQVKTKNNEKINHNMPKDDLAECIKKVREL
jgi:replicative DNA helicase